MREKKNRCISLITPSLMKKPLTANTSVLKHPQQCFFPRRSVLNVNALSGIYRISVAAITSVWREKIQRQISKDLKHQSRTICMEIYYATWAKICFCYNVGKLAHVKRCIIWLEAISFLSCWWSVLQLESVIKIWNCSKYSTTLHIRKSIFHYF